MTLSLRQFLFAAAVAASGAAQTVPESVMLEKQVIYSNGSRLAMDIALPKSVGLHPAIVAIHGGGFNTGDRSMLLDAILHLAEHGYAAASIDYRMSPGTQFPAALQDAKAAVKFLRANAAKYSIDPDRIGAAGHGAGGTLALLVALTPDFPEFEPGGPNRDVSARVSAVVALDPLTDLGRADPSLPEAKSLPLFLGGSFENTRAAYMLASPVNWATPQAPPILIARPDAGPGDQTQRFADQLNRVGASVEVFVAPAGSGAQRRAIDFFDQHLGITPAKAVVLVADHSGKGEVVAVEWPTGRELWKVPNRGGHDVQPLPDGHVLYTLGPDKKVIEMDAEHKAVWTYGPEEGLQHPISAQRLPNGNTLIGDAQLGKVIEIDKDRKVVWTYESADLANMRMRNSRRIANGNTLISVEAAGKIIEVDSSGKIVWTFTGEGGPKRRPYKGLRLPNGNTLVTMTSPGELVEVDPLGKIVRDIAGERNDIRMIWASGFDVLPSGNILLNDYLGHRIVELDAKGAVAHEVRLPGRNIASIAIVQ